MTDHELEQRLRHWYGVVIDPAEGAPSALRADLIAIPEATPRGRSVLGRWAVLLAATALGVALVATGIAIGMRLVEVPTPSPVPPPAPTAPPSTPSAVVPSESPIASQTPVAMRDVVAYSVETRLPEGECGRQAGGILRCVTIQLWLANEDGSDAEPLLPDWRARQQLLGWSADGATLYFVSTSLGGTPPTTNLWAAGVNGRTRMIDTGELCRDACGDVCDIGCGELSISPDGTQIAWARYSQAESVIAIFDIETGAVREIEATHAGAFPDSVAQPRWSPDGETLVFVRSSAPNAVRCFRPEAGALMTIRTDGSDLREIAPLETCAWDARWSHEGAAIVFSSDGQYITEEVDGAYAHEVHDVFAVNVDGSNLRQLTTDQISSRASWTTDGHIVFARIPLGDVSSEAFNSPEGFGLWIMDADGANARQLDASDLGELTAVGCQACLYPPPDLGGFFGTLIALWQPEAP